ncbi:MAG: hypothetical protein E7510_09795 [Ruminococcus sp.]|nr:hypothetical protein [Ruminococcus sp.]
MEYKKNSYEGVIYDRMDEYVIKKFIAVGGESIVFKGEKTSVGRTYALKFREVDRWGDFISYELKTLSRLEKCSTSKLAGIIPIVSKDIMQELYFMIPDNKRKLCEKLNSSDVQYFCIVEDYISGCDLKEYCDGDEQKGIRTHTPDLNSSYEQVVAFQRKLLNWTMQFCEIMSHVTGEYRYLHLDIKPENIMISNETESVTVIDFGKSIEYAGRMSKVSLNDEFGDNIGVYGTNGFAAPECCDNGELRQSLNISSTGVVDIRSDIFSFGAALWDCINPHPNIRIRPTEVGYFRRDLFNAPQGYIPELEEMIIKCTEKNPDDRYQTYEELKEAAVYAEKKLLERDKPSKTLLVFSILTIFFIILLVLSLVINNRRSQLTFEIAKNNFSIMAADYTEHNLSEYKDTAIKLIKASPGERQSYLDVLEVSYKDDDSITKTELEDVLLKCLDNTNDIDLMETYVNTVMQHLTDVNVKTVAESISIRKSLEGIDCDGMNIAKAITYYIDNPVSSYDTLKRYSASDEYKNAIIYLNKVLFNDSNIKKKIAAQEGVEVDELKSPLS